MATTFRVFVPFRALPVLRRGISSNATNKLNTSDGIFRHIGKLSQSSESAFYVNDGNIVRRQFDRWTTLLPRIKPHYAVKCSPDKELISLLGSMGAGFDCASRAEMALVQENVPDSADRIIFAHPVKRVADLAHAKKNGVKRMTFDSADELYKVAQHYPEAELVLRLLPDGSRSLMNFGSKFGAPQDHVVPLLTLAKSLRLNVTGVSFHVGSGCFDAGAFVDAVRLARHAFDLAKGVGYDMQLLDVGGGFPGALPRDDILYPRALRYRRQPP